MKAAAALTGATALLACIQPAHAQLDHPPEMRQDLRAERLLAKTMFCVVRGAEARAAKLLDIQPYTRESTVAMAEFLRDRPGCMPDAIMKFPAETLRGAIAERLYLDGYETAPVGPITIAAARPAWSGLPGAAAYDTGRCAAEREPEAADALVRAKRRSKEEVAAVDHLLPALRACGAGAKIDYSRTMIHGVIAEGLYEMRGGAAQ